jgi:hypothetical protein
VEHHKVTVAEIDRTDIAILYEDRLQLSKAGDAKCSNIDVVNTSPSAKYACQEKIGRATCHQNWDYHCPPISGNSVPYFRCNRLVAVA